MPCFYPFFFYRHAFFLAATFSLSFLSSLDLFRPEFCAYINRAYVKNEWQIFKPKTHSFRLLPSYLVTHSKNVEKEKQKNVNMLWVVIDARLLIKEKKERKIGEKGMAASRGNIASDKRTFYNLKMKRNTATHIHTHTQNICKKRIVR